MIGCERGVKLALVLMVLSLAFNMVFPFVSRDLFDNAIPSGKMSNVVGSLTVLGGAFLVSLVAGLRRADQSAYVSAAVPQPIGGNLVWRAVVTRPPTDTR